MRVELTQNAVGKVGTRSHAMIVRVKIYFLD